MHNKSPNTAAYHVERFAGRGPCFRLSEQLLRFAQRIIPIRFLYKEEGLLLLAIL